MSRAAKRMLVFALIAVFFAFAWFSLPHPDAGDEVLAQGEPAQGVVLAIDPTGGFATISHGTLQGSGMPPMTMVFRVPELAQLERIRPGDRVTFRVSSVNGEFHATGFEIVR